MELEELIFKVKCYSYGCFALSHLTYATCKKSVFKSAGVSKVQTAVHRITYFLVLATKVIMANFEVLASVQFVKLKEAKPVMPVNIITML